MLQLRSYTMDAGWSHQQHTTITQTFITQSLDCIYSRTQLKHRIYNRDRIKTYL